MSRRLVIDASVACAAGGDDARNPKSKSCRDALKSVLEVCHKFILSDDLADEWNKHQSRFARKWRAQMVARKKLIRVPSRANAQLRTKLKHVARTVKDANAMIKDCHLIEASIATDEVIISIDEAVRLLFKNAADRVGEIGNIVWVNPNLSKKAAISWLQTGAKANSELQLKFGSA